MAIAQVQVPTTKNTSGAGTTLAYASNVTAGSLLVGAWRVGSGSDQTITASDSLGQTWVNAVKRFDAGHGQVQIWYFANSAGGANTLTLSFASSATIRMSIHEYSGVATSSPVEQTNSGQGDGNPTSGYDVATTQADQLIFSAVGLNDVMSITTESGYNDRVELPAAPNTRFSVEDKIVSASGTYSGVYSGISGSGSPLWIACIATFKQAGGAAAPTYPQLERHLRGVMRGNWSERQ